LLTFDNWEYVCDFKNKPLGRKDPHDINAVRRVINNPSSSLALRAHCHKRGGYKSDDGWFGTISCVEVSGSKMSGDTKGVSNDDFKRFVI